MTLSNRINDKTYVNHLLKNESGKHIKRCNFSLMNTQLHHQFVFLGSNRFEKRSNLLIINQVKPSVADELAEVSIRNTLILPPSTSTTAHSLSLPQ